MSAPTRTLFTALVVLSLAPPAPAAQPHASHKALTFGNGRCAAVYDVATARINTFRDHVYARRTASEKTVDLCYDAYFGLRDKGKNQWLGGAAISSVSYVPGSGVVKVVQTSGSLTAEQYFFSPFDLKAPGMLMIVKVTAAAQTGDSSLFTLHNFHVGAGVDGTKQEQIDYDAAARTFVEKSAATGRVLLARSLTSPDKHGASPKNPYSRVQGGGTLADVSSSGVTDDAVSGFQYDLKLAAGKAAWYGVALAAGKDKTSLAAALSAYLKGRSPEQLLGDELKAWQAWHLLGLEPAGLDSDEKKVYQQALAVLRMGQCQEENTATAKPLGQFVASLPPGKWDISWVRDAAYAIAAMARAGHLPEARDGLSFMLNGKAGKYVCCDLQGKPYVGAPYHISVTRYFGDGTEETDFNADGPNIEFDNFGLFLWAAWEVVSRMDSAAAAAYLATWYGTMTKGVADVLTGLVDTTGLLRADSSIWEHHWENGKRRRHTYSNVMAVAGLRAMARMAKLHGATADATTYDGAAVKLAAAIGNKLVDASTSILISDLESLSLGGTGYMDAAVVEAFNHGVLPATGPIATQTLKAFDTYLGLSTGPGYKRNDDGDSYDEREWVVMDLRIASARFFRKEPATGQLVLDWITGMARKNYDLVPELLDQSSADYAGEIPMIGFGAGAYVLTLFDRTSAAGGPADGGVDGTGPGDLSIADAAGGDGGQDTGAADGPGADGPGAAPGDEGCGCVAGERPAGPVGFVLLLLGLVAIAFRASAGGRGC